jgi:hypothetical protein
MNHADPEIIFSYFYDINAMLKPNTLSYEIHCIKFGSA